MMNELTNRMKAVRVVILAAAGAAALAMAGCNAVSGVGKDIQEVSDNVKDAIEN